jgi:hypothetical protein
MGGKWLQILREAAPATKRQPTSYAPAYLSSSPPATLCLEDLGKSGAGSIERHGFQKLIAEIGLGNAGLVVSLHASRLARNNRDWHQLPELCSIFGILIADG